MNEQFDRQNVIESLRAVISLIEQGGSRNDMAASLLAILGDGMCNLNCMAMNSALFQNILDTLPVPVYYKDMYGVFIGCNDSLARLYGRKKSDIIGRTAFEIFTPEEAKMLSSGEMVLLNESNLEMVEHKAYSNAFGGSYHILYKKIILNEEGGSAGVLGIVNDITQHKVDMETAWQGEAFYKSLYENAPFPCVIFNSLSIVEDMNYAAIKALGVGTSYIGGDAAAMFAESDGLAVLMESAGEPVRLNLYNDKQEIVKVLGSLTVSRVLESVKYSFSFIRLSRIYDQQ
jgi:PAS domain S-box-containing protein